MHRIKNFFKKLWKDELGQSSVEYVVILLVVVGIVVFLGGPLKKKAKELVGQVFGEITGKLNKAGGE